MSGTVEIREEDGAYTAVDADSGIAASGDSKPMALIALAAALQKGDEGSDAEAELRALAERVRTRFEAEDVTEEDVEGAITWARSQ
jgi:hypothetical protein